ncbi:MAG: glycosyltransferase family 2 protein [Actinomycetota bacterium]|nr:glycosyltransferase family 2 protein [Actinomycetota bacterium]
MSTVNQNPGAASVPEIGVVIPLYWSAATIGTLVDRIDAVLQEQQLTYEIVVVDDGSGDDTWAVVESLLPRFPGLRGLRLTRNFGQQAALAVGLEASTANWVFTMDADLQDDPVHFPRMLDAAHAGADVVLAQWTDAVGLRSARWSSKLFYRVFNRLTGVGLPPGTGTYRVMSRRVVDHFLALPDRTEFFGGMIAWFGFPMTTVPVVRHERTHGKTGYSLRRRYALATSALVSFSTIPLKIAAYFGLIVCAGSALLGLAIVVLRFAGVIEQAGFAGIMVAVLFMSGTIMLSTGILGFYLGSLIKTTSQRPVGVIGQDTGNRREQ